MNKLFKIYFTLFGCAFIASVFAFIVYISILFPPILFLTIPAIILVICICVNSIRTYIVERKVVSELLNFDTIEDGVESLDIAKNMINKLQANNDTLYATRINKICIEQIKEKLNVCEAVRGLTDRNGKQVFEGDIVKHYHDRRFSEAFSKGKIFYCNLYLRWKRSSENFDCCLDPDYDYEVIGTIFDEQFSVGVENE